MSGCVCVGVCGRMWRIFMPAFSNLASSVGAFALGFFRFRQRNSNSTTNMPVNTTVNITTNTNTNVNRKRIRV